MKNFSGITDNLDITTKKYVDDGLAEKANSSDLATVATSGSYNDLSNKPTIPAAANNGKLTIQKNGTDVATFTANQKDGTTANITVPTKASDVNALSLDGGTINKSKTIKMDASANSNGANLKWGTVNSKNPYIGYASDQVDGTFVVGSLLGTNYASGLAIGGGSGNLLWKGTKVATTSDIPDVSGKANLSGGNTFNGNQEIQIDSTTAGTEKFIVNDAADGLELINATATSGLSLPNGFTTSGAIDCQQGATVGDFNGFLALDYYDMNHPVLSISDGAVVDLDGSKGTAGQVFTSNGDGTAPYWSTPAIKSATLTGTTLTITLP